MPTITPCLWFDGQAEEAASFYVSIFPSSRILHVARYPENPRFEAGKVMVVKFELDGQEFIALNGGPQFKFTEAISLTINCETQAEIDHYWSRLTEGGGREVQCGWLKDRYGLSWQVTPTIIGKLMSSGDGARSARVMAAMMPMVKIDIAALQKAYDGN